MTLREIAVRLDEVRTIFVQDLKTAFSASPLDWPLYMLAVTAVAAVLGLMLFVFAMAFLGEAWEKDRPAKKVLAPEFGPVGNFMFLAAVFFIAWLFALGTMAALMQAVSAGTVGIWISLAVATIAASFLIYLVRLGRRTAAQQKD